MFLESYESGKSNEIEQGVVKGLKGFLGIVSISEIRVFDLWSSQDKGDSDTKQRDTFLPSSGNWRFRNVGRGLAALWNWPQHSFGFTISSSFPSGEFSKHYDVSWPLPLKVICHIKAASHDLQVLLGQYSFTPTFPIFDYLCFFPIFVMNLFAILTAYPKILDLCCLGGGWCLSSPAKTWTIRWRRHEKS